MKAELKIAKSITILLENQFKVGSFKFGLDPVVGLIPGLGDVLPAIVSLYIVWLGVKMNIPQSEIFKMLLNIAIDFLIGLFPLIGDLFDFAFKVNTRNLKILQTYTN